MTKALFAVVLVVLAALVQNGEAVRCWTCSSDLDPYCNDPFDASYSYNSHRYTLTNCDQNAGVSYPYLTGSKSVCKKSKQYVNGELTIIRGCSWKRADDYSNQCPLSNTPNYVRTTFCETCEYDRCNGASGLVKSTAAILSAVAILLLFK